jgi:hypothetical protein
MSQAILRKRTVSMHLIVLGLRFTQSGLLYQAGHTDSIRSTDRGPRITRTVSINHAFHQAPRSECPFCP